MMVFMKSLKLNLVYNFFKDHYYEASTVYDFEGINLKAVLLPWHKCESCVEPSVENQDW